MVGISWLISLLLSSLQALMFSEQKHPQVGSSIDFPEIFQRLVFQVEFYQCTVRNSIESFSQVTIDEEGRTVRNLSLDITIHN